MLLYNRTYQNNSIFYKFDKFHLFQPKFLTELIDKVLDASGLRADLESEKSLEAEIRLENLEEFKSITKSFEEREGLISLEDFLLEISLISDVEEYKDDPNRISLMTVHSVKGLDMSFKAC